MRVIVPLQGVVQGRGGLVLGSLIPCALYYLLQLYLKRRRPNPPPPSSSPEGRSSPGSSSPSTSSSGQLAEVLPFLPRSLSRTLLSPRGYGGPAYVSGRVNWILKGGDSAYDVGLRKASEDPYDELDNPDGVIQLSLAENKVGLVLYEL